MTPQKYSQNLHTPNFFSEHPQNIEIQNSEPQKMTRAYVCMIHIRVHPPGVRPKARYNHKLPALYRLVSRTDAKLVKMSYHDSTTIEPFHQP